MCLCSLPQAKWNLQSLQQLSWDNEVDVHPSYPHLHTSTPPPLHPSHMHTQPVYHLTRQPLLLYLAHVVLVENASLLGCRVVRTILPGKIDKRTVSRMLSGISVQVWWGMRCCFIQQRLLEQRSATLWDKISQLMGKLPASF